MQYLVTGEFIDPGPLLPPDQLAGMLRQAVLPSQDVLTNLKSEGKLIAGGYAVGEKESTNQVWTFARDMPPGTRWSSTAAKRCSDVRRRQRGAISRWQEKRFDMAQEACQK